MNSHIYPNQPLKEVATEVKFKGNLLIEQVRAKYQDIFKSEYPRLMVPNAQQGVAPTLQPFRFEREDRTSGIQLAINSLSYFSREYQGHKIFLAEFEEAVAHLIELIGPLNVTRVGWRYVNAIPFTRDDDFLPLNKYFRENRVFGNALERPLTNIHSNISMPLNFDMQLNLTFESVQSGNKQDVESFLLDIDAFRLHKPSSIVLAEEAIGEVRALHDEANKIFEDMITDNYRAFLNGEVE